MPRYTVIWSTAGALNIEAETPEAAKGIVTEMPIQEVIRASGGSIEVQDVVDLEGAREWGTETSIARPESALRVVPSFNGS